VASFAEKGNVAILLTVTCLDPKREETRKGIGGKKANVKKGGPAAMTTGCREWSRTGEKKKRVEDKGGAFVSKRGGGEAA